MTKTKMEQLDTIMLNLDTIKPEEKTKQYEKAGQLLYELNLIDNANKTNPLQIVKTYDNVIASRLKKSIR